MTQREMIRYNRIRKVRKIKMIITGIALYIIALFLPGILDNDITVSVLLFSIGSILVVGNPDLLDIEEY